MATNVLGNLNNAQLPIKIAYALSKNISKITTELNTYNSERSRLLEKYSKKDDVGNVVSDKLGNVIIDDKFKEDWDFDIRTLLGMENDVDIYFIKLDDLFESNCSISPAELSLIDFMIEE